MEKENFKDLINKVKSNKQTIRIQKITEVKEKKITEIQFSFYLEKTLLKKLKIVALENEKSIKAIINEAIIKYLKNEH